MKSAIPRCEKMIREAVVRARQELVGKEAVLNTIRAGKYNQRNGVITSVIAQDDKLLALVMVWRKPLIVHARPTDHYLNSDRQTRTYWPLDCLKLTGRMIWSPRKEKRTT